MPKGDRAWLQQTCKVCRGNKEQREAWGCDKDTIKHQFEIDCPSCYGSPEGCDSCEKGVRQIYSCPNRYVDAETWEAICAFYELESHGILPEAGAMGDQTVWFIEANRYYNRCKAHINNVNEKRRADIQKRLEKRSR